MLHIETLILYIFLPCSLAGPDKPRVTVSVLKLFLHNTYTQTPRPHISILLLLVADFSPMVTEFLLSSRNIGILCLQAA